MLRDMSALKFFRRNSGKNSTEGNENIPTNSTDSSSSSSTHVGSESGRPPLITIQNPAQNPKSAEQEVGFRAKNDRTPSKNKRARSELPDIPLPFRTPEKQGFTSLQVKSRFGWGQRNESVSSISNGGKSPSCSSTQSTPNKSVTKPVNPAFVGPSSGTRPPLGMGTRGGISNMISKGFLVPSTLPMVVNTVEVPHFELKEDPSFWMDHNVQVLIRIRPLNSAERSSQGYSRCLRQESAQTVAWIGQPETRFTFDHVACEAITQEMLFRVAGLPMVENCLSGYNSCMFAYGQTGSGKTYTMLGEIDELEVSPSPDRGMTPRIFEFLFARIRAEEESRRDEKLKYSCKCSFLEIYNEQITDLLDTSSTNMLIREDMKKGVYVENLTEYDVETVHDILKLLTQGAANRKVAATNMNRESSRSHSVFTCVIESQWEKDSTTNLRFARLNLVDLAGSERQKTSGAEGERLKEAANINKSLSTLGHVIMVLVDIAHGKQRHVPYRDSRLTFLLQDSLGGNSKTMIIANVSPSICSSNETLSTLKFAQRAKLIQNNAVVNEDGSGDVLALQHQIQLLKEELSFFKRQNVSRSLSFRSSIYGNGIGEERDNAPIDPRIPHNDSVDLNGRTSLGSLRISTKKLKSLETTLAGALRREKVADTSAKHLEAEIEQLNRLVRQREEDTRCTKMMLRFREDKIRRMESVVDGLIPKDSYLLEENNALAEEIQLLRTRVDKNPEITRFALENIRLLDQLRRFQDFYEEGEREILSAEVAELRDQLLQFVEGNAARDKYPNLCLGPQEASQVGVTRENESLQKELNNTLKELEDCRSILNSCLEDNAKLTRDIGDLQAQLNDFISARDDPEGGGEWKSDITMKHADEIINLQLELDVLKAMLQEERLSRVDVEDRVLHMNNDLGLANSRIMQISKQLEDSENELKDSRSLIEALESQQLLSIGELEELRESNNQYVELLKKQDQEIKMGSSHCLQEDQSLNVAGDEESPFQRKLKKMQNALDKSRRLNMKYQNNQASQTSHEQEMETIRQQVEAETADAIVCLQEELQQQVDLSISKELEAKKKFTVLEIELRELQGRLDLQTQENKRLGKLVEEKDGEIGLLTKDWERLTCEIAEALSDGYCALEDASDQVEFISDSFPERRSSIGEQVGRLVKVINEKEDLIEELQKRLEDAQMIGRDLEWKLRSLRGATLAITEAQQQENSEKEREILQLRSHLGQKVSVIADLENKIQVCENQVKKAKICAAVAFVSSMNRLSEAYRDVEASDPQNRFGETGQDVLETKEKLNELKLGVLGLNSSMDEYIDQLGKPGKQTASSGDGEPEGLTKVVRTLEKYKSSDDTCGEGKALLLLREEIESALSSLRDVQTQMGKINAENEQIKKSEDQSQETIKSLVADVLRLQREMDDKEKQFEFRMVEFSNKLQSVEDMVEESSTCWYQSNKVFALELSDAKVVAAQKTMEASSLLLKYEEAQETMKEADILVNALMKTNETAKFEIERCRKIEAALKVDRESLIDEIQVLRSVSAHKELQYEQLKEQFASNLMETDNLVSELEDSFMNVQTTLMEEFKSITCDIKSLKSQILDSSNATKSLLEDIWSEIIGKDCAVSVLHLCHMGILLETVTGQNAEIGFLHHGLCESNSAISNLRENNLRAKRELETCSVLKGKLLADIKNSFDRIMKKEDETGKLSAKLSDFEKKILDLQMQEAVMLSRSNSMGCELAALMKEMDQSNKNNLVQEKLLKENNKLRQKLEEACNLQEQIRSLVCAELDFPSEFTQIFNGGSSEPKEEIRYIRELINRYNEFIFVELSAKDFELVILASEMEQRDIVSIEIYSDIHKLMEGRQELCIKLEDSNLTNSRMEGELETLNHLLQELKQEMIFSEVEKELAVDILMEREVEIKQCCENVAEMNKERMIAKQEVQSLKEQANEQKVLISSQSDALCRLQEDLVNVNEQIKTRDSKIEAMNNNFEHQCQISQDLISGLRVSIREKDLDLEEMRGSCSSILIALESKNQEMEILKEENRRVLDDLQSDMEKKTTELNEMQCSNSILVHDIESKGLEIEILTEKMKTVKVENEKLGTEIQNLKTERSRAFEDLEGKKLEFESSSSQLHNLNQQTHKLNDEICSLLACIRGLKTDLEIKNVELEGLQGSNSILVGEFVSKNLEIVILSEQMNDLKMKNKKLETEIGEVNEEREKFLAEIQNLKAKQSRIFEELETEIGEINEENLLLACIRGLKTDLDIKNVELERLQGSNSILVGEFVSKDLEIVILSEQMNDLKMKNKKLETEIGEVNEEREKFLAEIQNLKAKHSRILEEFQQKKLEFESASSQLCVTDQKNCKLNDELISKNLEIVILNEKMNGLKAKHEKLETEIREINEEREMFLTEVRNLKAEQSRILEELDEKKVEFESSSSQFCIIDQEKHELNEELKSKNLEMVILSEKMNDLRLKHENLETEIREVNEDREGFLTEVQNLKAEQSRILEELEEKKLEFESSSSQLGIVSQKNREFNEELVLKNLEIVILSEQINVLKVKNEKLETETGEINEDRERLFADVQNLKAEHSRILEVVEKKKLEFESSSSQFCIIDQKNCKLNEEICFLKTALEMKNTELEEVQGSLQAELKRKDDILKGLQFDLSLLQESASNAKDQKDEIEEIVSTLESLEDELALKSNELDEALAHVQMLEDQLQEKVSVIASLESELEKESESMKLVWDENLKLKADVEVLLVKKSSIEEDLEERNKVIERLDEEILEMGSSLDQMAFSLQKSESALRTITKERDSFDAELHLLKEQLEMAQSLADENEAIATEARQMVEAGKTYAEEKEEEVKLLEKSVEELESTINVLENKVEVVKGEAEKQRLQREELEMELQAVKHQMSTVHSVGSTTKMDVQNVMHSSDDDLPRNVQEKVSELQEARKKILILEKDVKEKETEIIQCKAHISELTLHAEAQASECKQKFKALEAMAAQVKPEPTSYHVTNATSNKMDKHAAKPRGSSSPAAKPRGSSSPFRGSGSPFKCIGLGLTHQINSEKDEELSAGRFRIEELEAVIACKQKEIFMLNTRLAAAESMTHDVIRDLLGVKLDMTNYASLLDHQQVKKITEKARNQNEGSREQEQEVVKLKKQLDEFIEERASWLEEINRRQAEMVAAKIACEKLQQRDQFLTAENEMLKMDNANHKKKVLELEGEVKKLSGQQNLQQRIHHHAKIKEENNHLKIQNEEFSAKLRRQDTMMSRLRDELARYRASNGKHPYVDVDVEEKLKSKLQETEEERIQLAQKLLSLCTSILKAAGITRPLRDITPSVAEDALNQLKDRVATAERELHDMRFKTRISGERVRLSELRQHASPLKSRTNENCPTPRRMSQVHL